MNELSINRWAGKSTEDVLAESYHELRGRIVNATGYLNVLKAIQLSPEEAQHYIDLALKHALSAQDIVDSVYQYMNEKSKD
jgi:predicted kinase